MDHLEDLLSKNGCINDCFVLEVMTGEYQIMIGCLNQ